MPLVVKRMRFPVPEGTLVAHVRDDHAITFEAPGGAHSTIRLDVLAHLTHVPADALATLGTDASKLLETLMSFTKNRRRPGPPVQAGPMPADNHAEALKVIVEALETLTAMEVAPPEPPPLVPVLDEESTETPALEETHAEPALDDTGESRAVPDDPESPPSTPEEVPQS
jgi:hypothetical protein